MTDRTRRQQIEYVARQWANRVHGNNGTYAFDEAFVGGALWADENRMDETKALCALHDKTKNLEAMLAIAVRTLEFTAQTGLADDRSRSAQALAKIEEMKNVSQEKKS